MTDKAKLERELQELLKFEYSSNCNKLGLTSSGLAAKALGISRASAHRYANGQWDVPETVAKLLRAMVKLGTTEI